MPQKTYPSNVSRTLDPNQKSLVTIVALHDHQITDADINEIQDLQDLKRFRLLNDQTNSGCLTRDQNSYNTAIENTFFIPAFDILFNGEVVTITGFNSVNSVLNKVTLPAPPFWTVGATSEPAAIWVVFLEMWLAPLNAQTGQGYYIDPINSLRYFYPYGCVQPDPSNAENLPDDTIDPFQGLFTTERAQIQWRINFQRVALSYDFSKYRFGLDPGASGLLPGFNYGETVYAQAGLSSTIPGVSPLAGNSTYQFANLGAITGDTGLWRAGDGNINNSLGTMDGYSYAVPLAVVFQRNSGPFSTANNTFGCADPANPNSGLLQFRISGRYDSKLADSIAEDDVVDTRQTINLEAWDLDNMMRQSFVDVIMGNCRRRVARGESPGNDARALGSTLSYTVSMSPTAIPNTDTVGNFDGFSNGFSSDSRTFYTSKKFTVNDKSVGTTGSRWQNGDSITVSLPLASSATISYVQVQALVSNTQNSTKTPVLLLTGQVAVAGLNSKAVTISFAANLQGTTYDPGSNDLYVTVGTTYPAGSGVDTRKIPFAVNGGTLADADSGKVLPVFGISEYEVQVQQTALEAFQIWAVNPEYSEVVFGTKIWLTIPGTAGVAQSVGGVTLTTFTLTRTGINNQLNGWFVTRAWDFATGNFYTISARSLNAATFIFTIQGAVDPNSTMVVSFLAQDTAQAAYNAPVKGITEVEETVLFGNYTADPNYAMDQRVTIVSNFHDPTTGVNTLVLASQNAFIKGIAGDDINKFVWVQDSSGNFNSVQINTVNFNNALITVTVPTGVDLTAQAFFFVGAILPAFNPNSTLVVEQEYVPYQGEGVLNRDYEVLHSEDEALITTNGTGAAPIVGLKDIYPYNRELPIAVTLPAQISWNDATLNNEPLATFFDSNYVAKVFNNVEHTFLAPLHTNDFIQPVNKDIRKIIRLTQAANRGFGQAIPHIGFAIATPTARTVLGQNLQSTIAPITLYVNNLNGLDQNDGLSLATPKLTITAAVNILPPVLRHPCVIILIDTGTSYNINQLQSSLQVIALGDGDIVTAKYYALANLSFVLQEAGRLVISRESTATSLIGIDATGFAGFGDGPTSAFFCDKSRVIFNGLNFIGFRDPAVKGIDSDCDFVDCAFTDNLQAGSFEDGCSVQIDRGSLQVPDGGTGFVFASSQAVVSAMALIVDAGANPGALFVAERGSSITLQNHGTTTVEETNIAATTVVANAQINSSIVVDTTYQTAGQATLQMNSVLSRTVQVNPFLGGIQADASSSVVTNL